MNSMLSKINMFDTMKQVAAARNIFITLFFNKFIRNTFVYGSFKEGV
jgi:hypothetical protein